MRIFIAFWGGFLACFIILFLLCNSATLRRWCRNRAEKRAEKKAAQTHTKAGGHRLQATKIIVFSILITYHLGFALGAWVVIFKDRNQLSALLTYTGSVAVFAVAFYCWKSKAENLLKIKRGNPDLAGSLSDFSNMSAQ